MADEMINKTKPYNKSTGLQGIGDTVKLMEYYDMNNLIDSVGKGQKPEWQEAPVDKLNKSS